MFAIHSYIEETNSSLSGNQNFEGDDDVSQWVKEFTSDKPWLVQVPNGWLKDNFNLKGLLDIYPVQALDIISGSLPTSKVSGNSKEAELQKEASNLYAQIHQRYLLTFYGAKDIQVKFLEVLFGTCPRVSCHHQRLLPLGLSPSNGDQKVMCYCCSCKEIYETDCDLDGSYFGPYFPIFFQQIMGFDRRIRAKLRVGERTTLKFQGIPIEYNDSDGRSSLIHPM